MGRATRWIAGAALVVVSAVAATAQAAEVVFINQTGAALYFLYASPTSSDSWGEDLLGSTILAPGDSFRVTLRSARALDIRAVDSNENEYIIWGWPLESRSVVIGVDAYVGAKTASGTEAIAWVDIWNETNYTIRQIIVVPAESGEWNAGEPLLEPWQAIHHGEYFRIDVDVERFGTFIYDIMLVDEDGDRYMKWDVNLELVGELVFTLDDIQF